jgi:pimeloyl-ACP methyl ester carboxylesterase
MSVHSYEVRVPESTLEDLRGRLARTRPLPQGDETEDDAQWEAGPSPAYLGELVDYWRTRYDWRAREAGINRFAQFRASVGGVALHFVHERGKGEAPLPIVLTHGFPDSFLRFSKLIPLLTDPEAHGGDARDAFDVVVPSLPGYGFSDRLDKSGGTFEIGNLWHKLMVDVLGYARFGAHGGDWGSTVTEHLARSHAHALIGIHLTDVPFWHVFEKPHDLSAAEDEFLKANERWQLQEGAYAMVQGTRPLTLADGLNDSPAGLAAWMVEKFARWSDCNGNVEARFTKDELLDNLMIYWVTETIGSSFMPYYDLVHASVPRWILEKAKEKANDWLGSSRVPAAFALFPKDIGHPPREWAQRFFDVQRWTEMPRGGHFAAMEEPALLAEDIRAFFRPLRRRA